MASRAQPPERRGAAGLRATGRPSRDLLRIETPGGGGYGIGTAVEDEANVPVELLEVEIASPTRRALSTTRYSAPYLAGSPGRGPEELTSVARSLARPVHHRVGDMAGRRDDVDGRSCGDPIARLLIRVHDRSFRHVLPHVFDEPGERRGWRRDRAPLWPGRPRRRGAGRARRRALPCPRRPASTHEADDERSRAADHREPHHPRAGIVEGVVEVTGVEVLQDCAGDERGGSQGHSTRERTARPPAKANANGRKPAARRACEIETRSERSVKSSGTSMNVNTASDPRRRTRPSAARGERGQRNEQERRDRDRTASREDLGARL